jgi:hypothetical protein
MIPQSAFPRRLLAMVLRCAAMLAPVVTFVPQAGAQPSAAVPEHARARA